MITPTPEQLVIISAARERSESLMIQAFAGCAKTTTLEMIGQALPAQPALALAFNVKIKKELEKRFPPHFTVKTLNGLGHSAWSAAIGKRLIVEDKKLGKLITDCAKAQGLELIGDNWANARALVSSAMHKGLVPSAFPQKGLVPDNKDTWIEIAESLWIEPNDQLFDFARTVLIEHIKMAFQGTISYDDQIYMSTLFNGVFPRFPLVLVDEAQDLSPLNHLQLKRCSVGRLIVVGDHKQAIYAFRGADSASMEKIRQLKDHWIDLPLATTFRCPKSIVTRQQSHAPGFIAFSTNPDGLFWHWKKDLDRPARVNGKEEWDGSWTWSDIPAPPDATIAVLCRNNAPLLGMAFRLIRRNIGAVMLGRDIGKGLVALSKKIIPEDFTESVLCVSLIREWQDKETRLALANGKEEKIDGIDDRAECLIAVIEGSSVKDAGALRRALTDLFARDSGLVTLATGHRAKGLEWSVVLHLDPWRVPSKFARQRGGAALEQEMNLKYVIETRTKHTLICANLEDFQ